MCYWGLLLSGDVLQRRRRLVEMAVPLLSKKIVKKRVKKFKRPQSDRKISVKVYTIWRSLSIAILISLKCFLALLVLLLLWVFSFCCTFGSVHQGNDDIVCRPSLICIFQMQNGERHLCLILNFKWIDTLKHISAWCFVFPSFEFILLLFFKFNIYLSWKLWLLFTPVWSDACV